MENDGNRSYLKTISGTMGSTVGARDSEQFRQSALSIANAHDRSDAAGANMAYAGASSTMSAANNNKELRSYSPLQAFTTIAGSGISNYGAFN